MFDMLLLITWKYKNIIYVDKYEYTNVWLK